MSGGGGTNTVVQQSSPPQQFLDAYSNVTNKAQQVASQPLQQYPGQIVAGLSPDQLAGIQATQSSYGMANPYINAAANYIAQSNSPVLTPQIQGMVNGATNGSVANAANAGATAITNAAGSFNPNAVSQWESPYTQDVVKATEAQFQNQNAQQQQQVASNAASQGAWGGDRSAVAQALTAGQEELAQAPVIANLEQQGYGMGLGAAQTAAQLGMQGATSAGQLSTSGAAQQAALGMQGAGTLLGANEAQGWLASQGGYGMANLGNEALATNLEGANALLGVGGLEQQQAQQELNVPYEQFLAQQAYPFQTTGWLSGITSGMGSGTGGTSSTSYPGAPIGSQIAGGALTGAGLLGQSGAFGSTGWLTGAGGLMGAGAGAGAAAGAIGGADAAFSGDAAISAGLIAANTVADGAAAAGGGAAAAGALAAFEHGGNVPRRASAGPVPQLPTNNPNVTISANGVPQLGTSGYGGLTGGTITTPNFGGMMTATGPQSVQDYLAQQAAGEWHPPPPAPAAPPPPAPPPPDPTAAMELASEQQAADALAWSGGHNRRGGRIQRRDEGGPVETDDLPESFYGQGPPAPPTMGMGNPNGGPQRGMNSKVGGDPWRAMMYAGLGMMGGTSPNALTNIGQGALKGLNLYEQDEAKRENAQQLAAYRQQQGQISAQRQAEQERHNKTDESTAAQRMMQAADEAAARIKLEASRVGIEGGNEGIHAAQVAEEKRFHDEELAQGHYTWQPGTQEGVEGSWRYSARGDEPPKFYPGVVQQRTMNADQRQTNFNTTQQATQSWRDTEAALRARGLNDNAVSNTMNNASRMVAADPTGKLTLQDAVKQLQAQRQSIAPAVPAAPAMPPGLPPGAKRAPDGNWYVPNPSGGWLKAVPNQASP